MNTTVRLYYCTVQPYGCTTVHISLRSFPYKFPEFGRNIIPIIIICLVLRCFSGPALHAWLLQQSALKWSPSFLFRVRPDEKLRSETGCEMKLRSSDFVRDSRDRCLRLDRVTHPAGSVRTTYAASTVLSARTRSNCINVPVL